VKRTIDPESTRIEIEKHLSTHVHWSIAGESWDFDFSRCQYPLQTIVAADLNDCPIQDEWKTLYIFGTADYAEGGGSSEFLGVQRYTGQVFGLDVERDKREMFLFNSGLERFIQTFQRVEEFLGSPPNLAPSMSKILLEIDPDAFPHSEWRHLSEHLENP